MKTVSPYSGKHDLLSIYQTINFIVRSLVYG